MTARILGIDRDVFFVVVRRSGWFAAAAIGAILFFALGVLFRVLVGPVSLGPLNGELHTALKQVVPGLDVRFDDAALEWSREEGRVNLVILGTRVLDRGGHIIAQAPKAEVGLAAGPFLRGRIVVSRIALVGVQLTLVHGRNGALRLGFESTRGGEDVLQRIREAISRSHGAPSSLKRFEVRDARLAFYDEETGAFVVAPGADLQVSALGGKAESQTGGAITARIEARIEISGTPARVFATLNFPGRGDLVSGDLSVTGLSLPALAADGKAFRFLTPLALKTDVTGSWSLSHGTTLKYADFGIVATGQVNALGHLLPVKLLRLVGRYDGLTGRVIFDDAELSGNEARVHLTGNAAFSLDSTAALRASSFELAIDRLSLDMPQAMERAVSLGHASIKGVYSVADHKLVLEQAQLGGARLSAALSGSITFASQASPELDLDGTVEPIGIRDLLPYWPLQIAPGARAWIASHVSAARVGPVLIHTRVPVGALDLPALPENAISVSFPVVGGTVSYLGDLTPITKLSATGTLTGDTFKANLASAAVGPLSITQGHVTIANLHVHGTPAQINVHAAGQLQDFLAILDMKPLQYPSRFHLNTQSARGSAAFDESFRVPTIKNVGIDAIAIAVSGKVNGLALTLGPHAKISDGALSLAVDNAGLHATGNANLGAANLDLDWKEIFNPKGQPSTHLKLRGVLDDAARAEFDLPVGDYLSGRVGADADLEGNRGVIQRASVRFDLTNAAIAADLLSWNKQPGVPLTALVSAELDQNETVHSANLSFEGDGLAASGSITLGPGGTIQSLDMPSVRLGSFDDFGVSLKELPASGLDLAISGRSLDASGVGRRKSGARSKGNAHESSEPFHVSVKVDKLALRNGVSLSSFALNASGAGDRPRSLTATAAFSKGANFSVNISGGDSERKLSLSAGDAGELLKGFIGPSIVDGGELNIQATLPGGATAGPSSDYSGEVTIKDCRIVNQSFLARLSSSGSFGGFLNMMRGGGIQLDTVHIPFKFNNNVINIHDARASGPSIGVTADGYIDRDTNQMALQGAIAPMYGLNGLLGAIPVIGDVFVSRKGEGVFGVTYSVQGDLDSPEVSVNPLSVLTPGILRRIFEGGVPRAPASPSSASAPTQTH